MVDLERERTRRLSAEIERGLRRSGARSLAAAVEGVDEIGRWRRVSEDNGLSPPRFWPANPSRDVSSGSR